MPGCAKGAPITSPFDKIAALRLVVAVSVLAYLGITLWGGWDAVAEAASRVGFVGMAAGCGLMLVNIWLRFVRWQAYLRAFGFTVPAGESLKIFVAGFAVAITPGGAGEPVLRGLYLRRFRAGFPDVVAAYIAERISDVISVLALSLLGMLVYPAARPVVAIVALSIALLVLLLRQDRWIDTLKTSIENRAGVLGRIVGPGLGTIVRVRRCFAPSLLVRGLVLPTIGWALTAIGFYYLAYLAGQPPPLLTCMFIYSFSILVGALSFLPGGLGSTEGTMIGVLLLGGMQQADAIAVTLLNRIVTLWFSVALGVACLYLLPRRKHQDEASAGT